MFETDLEQKITDLENLYKECTSNLNTANLKVAEEEKKITILHTKTHAFTKFLFNWTY